MAFGSYTGGATNSGNSSSPGTGVHGITINNGDLVVVYINSNSTTALSHSGGEGTAFTKAVDEQPSGETARQALYWKVAGGSEPTSYTFSGGSAAWRIIIKVFDGGSGVEVDAAAVSDITSGNYASIACGAYDGQVIADDALAVVFGGKDNRSSSENYTTANNSYTGVIGNTATQAAAGAHRLYTTGETGSGNVTINTADTGDGMLDKIFSIHMSFVESGSSGSGRIASFIKVPWTKQPPAGTKLNLSHPLARGIRGVFAFNEHHGQIRNLVNDSFSSSFAGDAAWDVDAEGRHVSFDGSGDYINLPDGCVPEFASSGDVDFTVIAKINKTETGTWQGLFQNTGSGSNGLIVGFQSSDLMVITYPSVVDLTGGSALGTGVMTLSYVRAGSSHSFYRDGALGGSTTNSSTPVTSGAGLIASTYYGGEDFGGDIYFLYIYDRALSASELTAINDNPWQIFEPQRIYVPISEALPDLARFDRRRIVR